MNFRAFMVYIATSVSVFQLSGCKFGALSENKHLNPGVRVGDRTNDARKAQVLIHYVNNPVETPVYLDELAAVSKSFDGAAILLSHRGQVIRGARDRLKMDVPDFTKALNLDLAEIESTFCQKSAAIQAGVVFINNSAIVSKKLKYCEPGKTIEAVPAEIADKVYAIYDRIKVNKIFNSSPLSHLDMLRASMDLVTELFPTDRHEYSLVVKSHGNEELAVTSKIAFESRVVTPKFLGIYFANQPETRTIASLDKQRLDKQGLDKQGLDKQGLDKQGLDKQRLEDENPIQTQDIRAAGISKEQLLQTIMDPERKMFFNVLFLESCKSDLGVLIQDVAETPTLNIGYLFTSDEKGLDYNTISYKSAGTSTEGSLRLWLVDELNSKAKKTR